MIIKLNSDIKVNIEGFDEFVVDAPFSDFGKLIRNGAIENPLVCQKPESIVEKVDSATMIAEKSFTVDAGALSKEHIYFHCDKIDTLCTGYINDKIAFSSNNSHIPVDVDIKDYLLEGENTVKIEITSPTKYIVDRQEKHKLPKNANGTDGAAYLRKPSCHFGWDWGPCVPYKFIGNMELQCVDSRLENIQVLQELNEGNGTIKVSGDNIKDAYVLTPAGDKIKGENLEFVVENPELWYTFDVSEKAKQPLYTVVISNDEMTVERKIGFRTIVLNQEADKYGTNFQFVLNGVEIFGKGASVIPFAAIPEDADNTSIDYYLDLCVKSNFNMIRIWGGGEYASDYLMERCDELGILIWQDFMYACLMYPFYEKDFLDNCLAEAEYNVKRQNHHPSLALWCGNNELEAMFSWMPKTAEIVKAYEQFFYHQLPEHIKDYAVVDYIATSPIGDKPFSKNTADEVGDTHMWNVWHGLKPLNYYEKRYTRFMSEFGLESLPSMTAIKQFATEEKDFDLKSDAFMSHQKCIGGNEKMMWYLKERFNDPVHFEDLPFLTGIVQGECVKYACEHFRRYKGRCNGALFWQLNDVWCCPSWSSVDFMGVPKALMYMAKGFFAAVSVSLKDNVLYFHNDTIYDKDLDVKIKIVNGTEIKTDKAITLSMRANSTTTLTSYTLDKNDVMRVTINGKEFFFDDVKKLDKVDVTAKFVDGGLVLSANGFAKNVYIEADYLDDNYVSLLPNEERFVPFDGYTIPEIKCENNIEFKHKPVSTAISQIVYRLKPMNIGNAFYYEYN